MNPASPNPSKDGSAAAERARSLAVFSGVVALALAFALYTNHVWEDYYITYRCSKNAANGHGLVFQHGERVHAFTSPLNVLIPAGLILATGAESDELVLWLFRVISSVALGAAGALLFRIARQESLAVMPTALLIGMFATDAKIVDFSINGQETGLMMFFLALTLYFLTLPARAPALGLGAAWAGLMWTRPDSVIYIGALGLGFLLFKAGPPSGDPRGRLFSLCVRAAAVAVAGYSPWLVWAWSYYGSPVPHTVIAKALELPALDLIRLLRDLAAFPAYSIFKETSLGDIFMPAYHSFGGWSPFPFTFGLCLAWLTAFYWVLPFGSPQTRAISFAFMLGNFYLTNTHASLYASLYIPPWYVPNSAFLGIVALSHIAQEALKGDGMEVMHFRVPPYLVRAAAVTALVMSVFLMLCVAYQLRIQQKVIEEGLRKQIGLWLRQNADSPRDTVFLEPLGYIGFYSQLKMLDFPGLSSPEVIAARRKVGPDNWAGLVAELRPNWLVLRPFEVREIYRGDHLLLTQLYSQVKTFDASKEVQFYRWIPGRRYLLGDQTFIVFKRLGTRAVM